MDNKRILWAVGLCIIVLVLWNSLFPPVSPVEQKGKKTEKTVSEKKVPSAEEKTSTTRDKKEVGEKAEPNIRKDFTPDEGEKVVVNTPLYRAVFNSKGGVVQHFVLKKYKQSIKSNSKDVDLITSQALSKGPMGLIWERKPTWSKAKWAFEGEDLELKAGEKKSLKFVGRMNGLQFVRKFIFQGSSYQIKEELTVADTAGSGEVGELAFVLSTPTLSSEDNRYNRTRVMYLNQEGMTDEDDTEELREVGVKSKDTVKWGAISSNYFLLGLIPDSSDMRFKARLEEDIYRLALTEKMEVPKNTARKVSCTYFMGPKEKKHLAKAPNDLKSSLQYGWSVFDIIAKPLMQVLKFFYDYTGNYGVAIIILTIIIKIIFWPLSQKSYKSMNKMKKIQPMMTQIKEKYKDDRQKMNEEMMRLYKTYKVNPAGGCLPMLVQIPVFIALYQALLSAVELRHAPFIYYLPFTDIVWLADLSAKDPLYITPLVMGATMFLQQKMTPSPGDPTQAKIMLFMPVVFTFVFLTFPSGLVVYWLANNILSIAQQWWMTKKQA